jgi:hypothetical protein
LGFLQPIGAKSYFHACGMARMPGLAPAGESLSLLTKKGTQRNHPEIARKPAVLTNFEAPPKLGERYRRSPQTVVGLKPQNRPKQRLA